MDRAEEILGLRIKGQHAADNSWLLLALSVTAVVIFLIAVDIIVGILRRRTFRGIVVNVFTSKDKGLKIKRE